MAHPNPSSPSSTDWTENRAMSCNSSIVQRLHFFFPFYPEEEIQKRLQENAARIKKRLVNNFSQSEESLMRLQSIIVWESPKRTAFIYIVLGLIFLGLSDSRPLFLLGLCCFILVLLNTWQKKIWPEINVPEPGDGDEEGWTPVHARLMSLPELCEEVAGGVSVAQLCANALLLIRRRRPTMFCLVFCFFNLMIAGLGIFVPGRTLVTGLALLVGIYPGVRYHYVVSRFIASLKPMASQLETSTQIHRRKYRKAARKAAARGVTDESEVARLAESGSDSELDEFCPPDTAATARALEKALAGDSDIEQDGPETRDEPVTGTALLTSLLLRSATGGLSETLPDFESSSLDPGADESYLQGLHQLEIPASGLTDSEDSRPHTPEPSRTRRDSADGAKESTGGAVEAPVVPQSGTRQEGEAAGGTLEQLTSHFPSSLSAHVAPVQAHLEAALQGVSSAFAAWGGAGGEGEVEKGTKDADDREKEGGMVVEEEMRVEAARVEEGEMGEGASLEAGVDMSLLDFSSGDFPPPSYDVSEGVFPRGNSDAISRQLEDATYDVSGGDIPSAGISPQLDEARGDSEMFAGFGDDGNDSHEDEPSQSLGDIVTGLLQGKIEGEGQSFGPPEGQEEDFSDDDFEVIREDECR